jgi:hypothetical protein
MSKRTWMQCVLVLGVLAVAAPSRAIDPWEALPFPDDAGGTLNTLGHGGVQIHDLDQGGAGNDIDWVRVPTLSGHSYEARLSAASVQFDFGGCFECAQFERVNNGGAILTEDVPTVSGTSQSYDRSIRWMASTNALNEYVRIAGHGNVNEGASAVYTLRFWDTTYSIPRWNASGGQVTVIVVSNLVQLPVSGNIFFYNAAGTVVAAQPFTVPQNGTFVLSSGSIPALAGLSGHAQVAHTGGYGGLAGKAVALEPATGFTFDSAMMAIPH